MIAGLLAAFLGLAFATETLAITTHDFALAASVALLLFAAVLIPRERVPGSPRPARLRTGRILAAAGLLLSPVAAEFRFVAFALYWTGLALAAGERTRSSRLLEGLAWTSLVFGLIRYGVRSSLLLWYGERALSQELSRLAGLTTGLPLLLNPTFSALAVTGLAIATVLGQAWSARTRPAGPIVAATIALAVVSFAYLQFFALLPARHALEVVASPIRETLYPLGMGVLLALGLTPCLVWFQRRLLVDAARAYTPRSRSWAPVAVALCSLSAALCWVDPPRSPAPRARVVFYEKGFVNWITPTAKRYGTGSIGMMGNLPGFVEALGWESARTEELDDATLADADVLVIVNKTGAFPPDRVAAIDRFVARGGGLLLLGDHTAFHETKLPGNQLLAATGIRFRFDNAEFLVGGWLHSYEYWPHETTLGLGDHRNDAGSVIGASLDVSYPAIPLVVGRAGFSDPGDDRAEARGYMGNRELDAGEELGDMVLVAAQSVGQGRVAVFGDTSAFSNGLATQCWPFIARVFHWLGSDDRTAVPAWRDSLGLALLLAAVGLCLLVPTTGSVSWICALLALLAFLPRVRDLAAVPDPIVKAALAADADGEPRRRPVALIDNAHRSAVPRTSADGKAIFSAYVNLMREGFVALGVDDLAAAQLAEADLLLMVAPTRTLTNSEVDRVLAFMERGGLAILATGWDHRAAVEPLLEPLGLALEHRPMGRQLARVAGDPNIQPNFWCAWTIAGGEVVADIWGHPVVVRARRGRGSLILIGDGEFLTDRNVEHERLVERHNIDFFHHLIASSRES